MGVSDAPFILTLTKRIVLLWLLMYIKTPRKKVSVRQVTAPDIDFFLNLMLTEQAHGNIFNDFTADRKTLTKAEMYWSIR